MRLSVLVVPLLGACLGVGCSTSGGDDDDSASGIEEGYGVGDRATDFSLPDQDGNPVRLSDYSGSRVLLDFSALWCTPCGDAADNADAMQEELAAEFPFQYLIVVIQDEAGQVAEVDDAAYWSDEFELSVPVLADTTSAVAAGYLTANGANNLPQFFLIDEDLVIREVKVGYGTGDEQELKDALRAL